MKRTSAIKGTSGTGAVTVPVPYDDSRRMDKMQYPGVRMSRGARRALLIRRFSPVATVEIVRQEHLEDLEGAQKCNEKIFRPETILFHRVNGSRLITHPPVSYNCSRREITVLPTTLTTKHG